MTFFQGFFGGKKFEYSVELGFVLTTFFSFTYCALFVVLMYFILKCFHKKGGFGDEMNKKKGEKPLFEDLKRKKKEINGRISKKGKRVKENFNIKNRVGYGI